MVASERLMTSTMVLEKRGNMTEKKKILVAEDEVPLHGLFRRVLEGAGYSVHIVNDGVEALDALREADFDVLLTDVNMPRMGGFVLVAALPTTKFDGVVVMMTGRLGEDEQRARIEALVESGEVREFFGKPCKPQDVRDAVALALEFLGDRNRIDARHRDRDSGG